MAVDGLYVGREEHVAFISRERVSTESVVSRSKGPDTGCNGVYSLTGFVSVFDDGASRFSALEAGVMFAVVHRANATHAFLSEFAAVPNQFIAQGFKGEILSGCGNKSQNAQVAPQCPRALKKMLHLTGLGFFFE